MARPITKLEQLGAYVASALEADSAQRLQAVETARRRFLEQELNAPSSRTWFSRPGFGLALGLAAALTVAAVLVFTRRSAVIAFDVDGAPGVARTWLAAPEGGALNLAFSEGTRIRLEAAARARVAEIDEHGASLTLEGGRLHAQVVHRWDATWKVVAGPFTVRVTGTEFDVNWDANSQQLAVKVDRGSVAVRDTSTGVERVVGASETLRVFAYQNEHRFELASSASSSEPSGQPALGVGGERGTAQDLREGSPTDNGRLETRDEALAPSSKSVEPSPGRNPGANDEWRTFAKRGALREAFASAAASGFTRSCAGASPAELLLLGDGARLSGDSARAEEALLTLRRRYPTDARRAAAAFSLGKVAFDQKHAYEQAAAWFSTSLREQPGGPLARDAAGRLIEALRRADDSAAARRAARDYLDKYPEGPHADLARSVLR